MVDHVGIDYAGFAESQEFYDRVLGVMDFSRQLDSGGWAPSHYTPRDCAGVPRRQFRGLRPGFATADFGEAVCRA